MDMVQASSLAFLEYHLRTVLANDSSAISTLRCLKLYLERLGCNHLDADTMHAVAGSAFKLVRPQLQPVHAWAQGSPAASRLPYRTCDSVFGGTVRVPGRMADLQ